MQVDTTMVIANAQLGARNAIGDHARKLETLGYDAAFAFEGQHDPFLPLALAAQATSTLKLGTGIAVAFARNPMNLANLGYDLQLMTQGRFILGLGSQVQAHIEKRFSMPWSRPAARMRELILAIRAIWDSWQNDVPLRFEGEFYRHTLMTPTFSPGPNPHGMAKIVAAGVGSRMTEAVCEVADGFTVHPFNTARSLREITLPAIEAGLRKNPVDRSGFDVSCNVIIATGRDERELAKARAIVKKQLAFYGSTPAYRPVLECEGWGDLQLNLNRLSKEGRWDDMAALIDDEMVDALAVVAPRDEIAQRIHVRLAGVADRVNLVARYADDDRDWADIVQQLHASGGTSGADRL
ncbi:LLM class F420-dependent oxidoreductase [Sphingobium estronivorans]|uniref:LLM class F420-dependent oxidoreductase n=1 Tax=Sphingobium estronivorans TaxID=1577690 RepID=UPI001F083D36|nr:LLM class F420-dependent oxidoreductase [Sphingobium estronivorans]